MGSPSGTSGMKSTGGNGGGALRDLLSSVAQQVESHLHPSSLSSSSGSRHGRRSSRIRSWIAHDRDRDKDGLDQSRSDDGGDTRSLHFTDSSDDDFEFVDASDTIGYTRNVDKDKRQKNVGNKNKDPNQTQHPRPRSHRLSATAWSRHDSKDDVRKMHMLPDDIKEEETVDMLTSLMGDGFDREVARRILRKYDGNVDKAAGALVEGERGEELIGHAAPGPGQIQSQGWPAIQQSSSASVGGGGAGSSTAGWSGAVTGTQTQTRGDASSGIGGRPNTPVIDLTNDEDTDLQRAVQESMSSLHAGSQSQTQAYAPSYAPSQLQQSYSQTYAPAKGQSQEPGPMQTQTQTPERPVFGPSERPSDPNWAIVPSHVSCSSSVRFDMALLTMGSLR